MRSLYIPFVILTTMVIAACSSTAAPRYTVVYPASPEQDGLTTYIVDYDTGAKIDSTVIAEGRAALGGEIDEPRLVRLIVDGQRAGVFILEKGDIKLDPQMRLAHGTKLNDRFARFTVKCDSIEKAYDATPTDSAGLVKREGLIAVYNDYNRRVLEENADNPIGYYIFLQQAYELTAPELEQRIAQMPQFADYNRINNLRESLKKAAASDAGAQYLDFAVQYNDSTYRLSDYVGRHGRYTLVDFWASWCGPCIKEIRTIKRLYNKYGADLNVVGVAVWDEPENTAQAVKNLQIPWPVIYNAQSIPTDLYGISGIPCIILIDPEGRIISRGKQGDELVREVEQALEKRSEPATND